MQRGNYSREISKSLASTALGEKKADFVVKNSTLVNVYSGGLIEGVDVAVKNGRIALVGNAGHTIGDGAEVIDVKSKYLAPGLLDGHVHIDDSMGTVTEFARVVVPRGTTGVFMDPHEIANVLGLEGVKMMIEESKSVPLRVYTSVPSCVPATSSEFETAGAEIGPKEIRKAMQWEETIALGEMMNYPGVVFGEDDPHAMIEETLKTGKVIEGHAPDLEPEKLNAYVASGITSCHESTKKIEALEKLRLGMYPMIREGFASIKNLSELTRIVTEDNVDTSRISLATDDRHPGDLVTEGHMDHVIKRAVEEGVDPVKAIQMATVNTATHFKIDDQIGGIAPGRFADMIVFEDLSDIKLEEVIVGGKVVARNGKMLIEMDSFEYPERARNTVRIPRRVKPEDFKIKTDSEGEVKARVIGVNENTPVTENLTGKLPVEDEVVQLSSRREIAKVAVIERHKRTGNVGLGLVEGFGFNRGATASTIAHDSHNLLIVGKNDKDMALAANKLAEVGGGVIVVKNGEVLAMVELPIAGLMADRSLAETHKGMKRVSEAWNEIGCKMSSPFPTLILLALPVLPKLRITDKGLIDTVNFEKVNLIRTG
ncbi:adenosine deaminase [candidate division MSBL1 archaeon SCGC-AAA261F17]|uniref:Adenine deaminase n=1 Tax=candidate division MSBL1 archaeon SCGC-AAA261F17 TaxID=1698274 RepID=A0A133V7K9_9EURY|nr:adenosine deaminase [candidate division MSBL1 archaeon SCGC-AAA261F17]